jgi:hypothetical protein
MKVRKKVEKAIRYKHESKIFQKVESTKGKPRAGIRRMDWCWSADLKNEQTRVW